MDPTLAVVVALVGLVSTIAAAAASYGGARAATKVQLELLAKRQEEERREVMSAIKELRDDVAGLEVGALREQVRALERAVFHRKEASS